ncbi:MAG TPA: COX15/CtaA family protein, partial [Chitinophagaceae bacterium]|nr:COX15/CtaA family protein [Chitinophagaceae bacterium]
YAPTWPDINGAFLATSPDLQGGFLHKICYDPLLIQFIHRLLAYCLGAVIVTWLFLARQLPRVRNYPLLLVMVQVCLGIACLLNAGTPVYIWLAVLHQLNGILLLLSMVAALYRSKRRVISL